MIDQRSAERILIVDDDRTTRDTLRMLLEFEGLSVTDCPNGMCALDLAHSKAFTVFIVDYRMPEMNGDRLTRDLRRLCPDSLIIGFSVEAKEKAFLDAGADFFLNKDLIAHDLISLIKTNTA